MKTRTILHVTQCYTSGVARAIDTIVELSPSHEHHLLWSGEELPHDGFASATRLPRGGLSRTRAVRRTVRSTRADLVHAHSSFAGAYARAVGAGAPVVYQPHGYKVCDPHLAWVERQVYLQAERFLGRRTAQVVVLSPEEERIAAEVTPRSARTFLPNVPGLSATTPRVRGGGERERLVVMAGRICDQKDPDFFADAAERIRRLDPTVALLWLGQAVESPQADRLRRAGVEITGWLAPPQMVDVLQRAGAYLHSAAYEGFPISLLDALWCDAPALVRPLPAFAGLDLPTAATPHEAADLALALLDDDERRAAAHAAGAAVLAAMNESRQREAIARIYG